MHTALPSFIMAYHGCDEVVAERIFAGQAVLKVSNNDYDWLGDGIYFFEHNAQRAYDFAMAMSTRPHPSGQTIRKPSVVGAVIDLGYCLNMLDSYFIDLVRQAHLYLQDALVKTGEAMPRNKGGADLVDRKLDCAVLRMLHNVREEKNLRPFDTVRAAFFEGERLYDNAGFAARNHIQICVRNHRCIQGYFRPLTDDGKPIVFH